MASAADYDASSLPGAAEDRCGVVVVAEGPYTEGFGDNSNPSVQEEDLEAVRKLRSLCGTLVMVVFSGRPIDLVGLEKEVDALVAAWLPGSEGGPAVWDALCGVVGFSGKLSMVWPRSFDGYEG